MVARVLNLAGLYLGPESDLLPANAANAEGYWENYHFVSANDRILAEFGGGWDHPPKFPVGWEKSDRVLAHRIAATAFMRTFDGYEHWGWKDPRNSVTMEFWRELLPDLKVVICVRNPVEIARSLTTRGASSEAFSLDLWLDYSRRLIDAVPPGQRLITHYISFFDQPQLELARLLEFLGMVASEEQRQAALAAIKSPLRHSHATLVDLLAAEPPFELVHLYQEMCLEAGPAYEAAAANDPQVPHLSRSSYDKLVRGYQQERQQQQIASKDQALQLLTIQNREHAHAWMLARDQLQTREGEVKELISQLAERDQAIQALSAQIAERDQVIRALSAQIAERDERIRALDARVDALMAQFAALTQSRSWKVARLLGQLRARVVPAGSVRAYLARGLASPLLYVLAFRNNRRAARDAALIRASPLFDANWYLARNPDVAAADMDPALHYARFGGVEARDPSPEFSGRWYLETYPDVRAAGVNPLVHYLRKGRQEGRVVSGTRRGPPPKGLGTGGQPPTAGRRRPGRRIAQLVFGGLADVVSQLDERSRTGTLHRIRVFLVPPASRRAQYFRQWRDTLLAWVRRQRRPPAREEVLFHRSGPQEPWLDDETLLWISNLEHG